MAKSWLLPRTEVTKTQELMSKNIGVDPGKLLGLQGEIAERFRIALRNGDPSIPDAIEAVLKTSYERRAMIAQDREFVGEALSIDRSQPFDLSAHKYGDDNIVVEQDERSLAITSLLMDKVSLVNLVPKGEFRIKQEDWRKQMKKQGHICLDAKVFQTLLENPDRIPIKWKEMAKRSGFYSFMFEGTVLSYPKKQGGFSRFVPALILLNGKWSGSACSIDDKLNDWSKSHVSTVIRREESK
jgi:hypothetical protein